MGNNEVIVAPEESRVLAVREESRALEVPGEIRLIEVQGGRPMPLLGSKQHTSGDVRRWRLDYGRWLENTATILSADVTSSSLTCTADNVTVLGREIVFYLNGGEVGETLMLGVAMTDSLDNVKHDTISYTVVAP